METGRPVALDDQLLDGDLSSAPFDAAHGHLCVEPALGLAIVDLTLQDEHERARRMPGAEVAHDVEVLSGLVGVAHHDHQGEHAGAGGRPLLVAPHVGEGPFHLRSRDVVRLPRTDLVERDRRRRRQS